MYKKLYFELIFQDEYDIYYESKPDSYIYIASIRYMKPNKCILFWGPKKYNCKNFNSAKRLANDLWNRPFLIKT
jgi:hypothetical protein